LIINSVSSKSREKGFPNLNEGISIMEALSGMGSSNNSCNEGGDEVLQENKPKNTMQKRNVIFFIVKPKIVWFIN
jgi:hypothetical protein